MAEKEQMQRRASVLAGSRSMLSVARQQRAEQHGRQHGGSVAGFPRSLSARTPLRACCPRVHFLRRRAPPRKKSCVRGVHPLSATAALRACRCRRRVDARTVL
eukprot:3312290-Pleurochrysis_carterae.AAC.1